MSPHPCPRPLATGPNRGKPCGRTHTALYGGEWLCGYHEPRSIEARRQRASVQMRPQRKATAAEQRVRDAAPAMLAALKAMVAVAPAFRSRPLGAPGSYSRAEQDAHVKAEDDAILAIAEAEGRDV